MNRILATILMMAFSLGVRAEPIALAEDLALDAKNADRDGKPIVLFVTADHCPYCEKLRDEYFKFSPGDERFILREIELDQNPDVVDFSGAKTKHQAIADSYNIWLTPTVAFIGPDGKQLTDPLVGVLTMDFYHYYFEEALAKSVDRLNDTTSLAQK